MSDLNKLLVAAANVAKRKGDVSNAGFFSELYRDQLAYCHPWGEWLVWDGMRWGRDESGRVEKLAKDAVLRMYELSRHAEFADELGPILRSQAAGIEGSKGKLLAMIDLARCELPVRPDELDRDPWSLNVLNGTIDLKTGELRGHNPGDRITKLAPVRFDRNAACPAWERFISAVLPDIETRRFFQRFGGYSLTGSVREQVVTFLYGTGANGKTTAINAVLDALGTDYGIRTAPELVMVKKNETHPTDRADLFGRRLAIVSETEDGKRLAESFVKDATGADRMRARRLYQDGFEFEPTHKIVVGTNYLPEIRGTDHGIWRRLRIVPFTETFWNADADAPGRAELRQDKDLPAKLKAEASGVLNWLLAGCRDWLAHGLPASPQMLAVCGQYRSEQDTVGQFLREMTVAAPNQKVSGSVLYAAYKQHALKAGAVPVNNNQFARALAERGYQKKANNGVWYVGLGMITEGTEGTEGSSGKSP